MAVPTLIRVLITGILLWAVIKLFSWRKDSTPLPPGPKPLPIIGNLRDLPPKGGRDWDHWKKHKDLYGPISSLSVFGTTIVIFNDPNLAYEVCATLNLLDDCGD
jgi:hypothetical protein